MPKKTVELQERAVVIYLPVTALSAKITCEVPIDGKIEKVRRKLDMDAIQAAFRDAERNYIPDDAIFTLTDIGKKLAEESDL